MLLNTMVQLQPGWVKQEGLEGLFPGSSASGNGVVAVVSTKANIPVVDVQRRIPGSLQDAVTVCETEHLANNCTRASGSLIGRADSVSSHDLKLFTGKCREPLGDGG